MRKQILTNEQQGINAYDFLHEVKQIFPNATIDSIKLGKILMNLDFCYCYGGISLKNYPDIYHNQIIKINLMAKVISKTKKRHEQFILYSL